jgi:hypothetical protein
MHKEPAALNTEQQQLCVWFVETWESLDLGDFPEVYTLGYIGKSLKDFERAGVSIPLIRDSLLIAMNLDRIPSDEKWIYACGITWNKFKQDKPLKEAIEEWKEGFANEA